MSENRDEDKKRLLTCTRCGYVMETYSEREHSQGKIVCRECKKETIESDKRAFDRDMEGGRQ